MTPQRAALVAGAALLVATIAVLLMFALPRSSGTSSTTAGSNSAATATGPGRTIKVRLFYVSADGTRLTSVEREVPFAEGVEQAREILNAQLAPVMVPGAPEPVTAPEAPAPGTVNVSAVPPGTVLRALYITDRGDAYVDLSREVVTAHSGGTLNELLTVYTIVDALTVNLPAVRSVQILVEGREVQTLAGHVDLREPLAKNLGLVQ